MIFTGRNFAALSTVLIMTSALAMSGCSSSDDEHHGACSPCEQSVDCDSGLSCFTFNDGSTRCAEDKGDACTALLFAAPSSGYSPFGTVLEAEEEVIPGELTE
jgi:hypothetical protein